MRKMVIGDLLNTQMLKEAFEIEFLGTLWTHGDSGMMTPYVCECSFGDGLKLMAFSTINQRPNYHIVRVGSDWDSDVAFSCGPQDIDEIMSAIEDECGPGRPRDEWDEEWPEGTWDEEHDPKAVFPALDDRDGCSWGEISWLEIVSKIGGTAYLSLPYSWADRVLEPHGKGRIVAERETVQAMAD